MGLKSELLTFTFGLLLLLVTFGDNHKIVTGLTVGNLDTILGVGLWPVLDVVYPLATIAVFLLYCRIKGTNFRAKRSIFLFSAFLLALALMNFDDIVIVLNHVGLQFTINSPISYWIAISWIYPVYSATAFFLLGKLGNTENP